MDKDLEKEVEQLIDKKINSKKSQFGKAYSEVGTSDSNLVLRTKGDIKIQWGGKFIDLIKNGKINSDSSLPIKYIKDESNILAAEGIYITEEGQVFIGNSNKHINVTSDLTSFISFKEEQNLEDSDLIQVQKNLGIIFESEQALRDSNLKEGIVYLLDQKLPYLFCNDTLTTLLPKVEDSDANKFDQIEVEKIISKNGLVIESNFSASSGVISSLQVENLEVSNLSLLNSSQTEEIIYTLSNFTQANIGDYFEDYDIAGDAYKGTILNITEDSVTIQKNQSIYTFKKVYAVKQGEEISQEEREMTMLCTLYSDSLNTFTFDPKYLQCSYENVKIFIYGVNFEKNYLFYKDVAEEIPLEFPNDFNCTGFIKNSTLHLKTVKVNSHTVISDEGPEEIKYDKLELNNCSFQGDLIYDGNDTTSQDVLNILKDDSYKEIIYSDNKFKIQEKLPANSLILCKDSNLNISDVEITVNIPALPIVVDSKTTLYTTATDVKLSLKSLILDGSNFKWKLL